MVRSVESCTKRDRKGYVYVEVNIQNIPIEMNVDSGASVSCISKDIWKKLGCPKLTNCHSLRGYMNSIIPTKGIAMVDVKFLKQSKRLLLYVTERNNIPILGQQWMLSLGIFIRIDQINNISEEKNVETIEKLKLKYARLFSTELGLIRDFEANINVSKNVVSKIHKPREVPIALRERVELELQRLVNAGVLLPLYNTNQQLEWASPIVIIQKDNSNIRICGDFKVTINKYINPEPFHIPKFEEIMSKLEGGQKFTVIDLKDAYLQMKVSESSKKYLTISTHIGFFTYTRLPFGVSSAPSIFQTYMCNLLSGIKGVASYLDDIIITGKDDGEHIQNLSEVMKRLWKSRLTTRPEKCKLIKIRLSI